MTCFSYGNATVCTSGATKEIHRESLGVKWCFSCRKRVKMIHTVTASVEPSYYGPTPAVRCEHGHPDGDLFPGYEREWE